MCELVDSRTCLARTGIDSDKPAATKLSALPSQSSESRNIAFAVARNEQETKSDEDQQNASNREHVLWIPQSKDEIQWRDWTERNEFHSHALPMR